MAAFIQDALYPASRGETDLLYHLPALTSQLGRPGSAEDFYREWLEYENVPSVPMWEAVRALHSCGWRVYLATNQEARRTQHLLDVCGLRALSDGLFASYAPLKSSAATNHLLG